MGMGMGMAKEMGESMIAVFLFEFGSQRSSIIYVNMSKTMSSFQTAFICSIASYFHGHRSYLLSLAC
jgi:hypothetical protein